MKFVVGMVFAAVVSFGAAGSAFAEGVQTQTGATPGTPGTPGSQATPGSQGTPATQPGSTTGSPPPVVSEPVVPPPTTEVVPPIYSEPVGEDENTTYWRRGLGAPKKAFELGVSAGYTQGFGSLGADRSFADIGGPGGGVGLTLGYRATPHFGLALRGEYQELSPKSDLTGAKTRGTLAGFDLVYHMSPYSRVDLWTSLGAGYRFLWEVNGRSPTNVATSAKTRARAPLEETNVLRHGVEIARLQLGFDVRVSKSFGLGPVIGADVNTMLWRDEGRGKGSEMMSGRGLSTMIFGGIQGRFDIGGERVDRWAEQMARLY